jgi:hypothetical protein
MILTPELLADLRKTAMAWIDGPLTPLPDEWTNGRLHPRTVLALLDRIAELEQRQARGPVTAGMYTPIGFEPYPGYDACGMDFDTWAEATRKRIAGND